MSAKPDQFAVSIVGAGGLGCPAALTLLALWPKEHPLILSIIDPDEIELSNLNRQILYSAAEIGRPKATVISKKLQGYAAENLHLKVKGHQTRLNSSNIDQLLVAADYVIEATDSVETKFLVNDFCVAKNKPFCYAGVVSKSGQAPAYRPGGACLRCLFGNFSESDYQEQCTTCQHAGVIGAIAGCLGAIQAHFAVSALIAEDSPLSSMFVRVASQILAVQPTAVTLQTDCPLGCGSSFATVDLRDKRCPATFLYTKLALEQLPPGANLQVVLGSEDSVSNVRRSAFEFGHTVLGVSKSQIEAVWVLKLKKKV